MKKLILGIATLTALVGCGSEPTRPKEQVQATTAAKQDPAFLQDVQAQSPRLGASSLSCPKDERGWQNQAWKKLMGYANGCVVNSNFAQVEKLGNTMATMDPMSPWGSYYLSLAAQNRGDLPRALWMIELARKKATNSALVLYQEGRILYEMHEIAGSVDMFRQALKADGNMLEANLALGHMLYRERYTREALPYFEKALEQDPNNLPALTAAAECRSEKNDFAAAALYLQRLIRLDGKNSGAISKLAEIQEEKLKDYPGALDSYKQLRRLARNKKEVQLTVDIDGKIKNLETLVAQAEKVEASSKARGPSSQEKQVTK
jgi:tetratricopeptide (TPR) repeat protein